MVQDLADGVTGGKLYFNCRLNSFVINLVSFPVYVNLAHICELPFLCFSVCLPLVPFMIDGSHLLLWRICFIVPRSRSLASLLNS